MSTLLTPTGFAVRQAIVRSIPLWVLIGVLACGWALLGPKTTGRFLDTSTSIGLYLFYILATGGIALGYLGWWLSLYLKGMMSTPRHPWQLAIRENELMISTGRVDTFVNIDSVRSFRLLSDDNWDKMNGMEDFTLVAKLGKFSRILIPGSAQNFDEILEGIRRSRTVEVVLVE
ncbi:hypothetical protein GTP41_12445 [Pseudoduganella sp. DS3]|uniref:Uncharacterized protein n=1 Tax=Pseudoduganella guangdongensis TaxID=2692179 RepID=A0A6N9HHF8_9BURK|nr:hypothetical protein [Pseudoduganella guangdongensis]MYN02910.1 hypothetical protein [Pseudoduganella guangdongensis]